MLASATCESVTLMLEGQRTILYIEPVLNFSTLSSNFKLEDSGYSLHLLSMTAKACRINMVVSAP